MTNSFVGLIECGEYGHAASIFFRLKSHREYGEKKAHANSKIGFEAFLEDKGERGHHDYWNDNKNVWHGRRAKTNDLAILQRREDQAKNLAKRGILDRFIDGFTDWLDDVISDYRE